MGIVISLCITGVEKQGRIQEFEREGRLTYLFFKGIGGLALKRIDKCRVEKKCKTAILFHTADVYGVPHIFVLKTFMALEHRKLLTTFF